MVGRGHTSLIWLPAAIAVGGGFLILEALDRVSEPLAISVGAVALVVVVGRLVVLWRRERQHRLAKRRV